MEKQRMKEIRRTVNSARNALFGELKVQKKEFVTSIDRELMEDRQRLEEMKASLENYVAAQRKRTFSELDTYEQSVRELFLLLEEKYPFHSSDKEKDVSKAI
ncbi:hypothetical protein TNCT_444221 [Trichonephila clavata]|uniref:Uncharacterized protein n=1 Tax=Trichonephila clavata TaxID=2740835 RepID=A0A8X6FCH2_TRICU|nr:hypothetical protein TNCT_444221 [Trichonephila clavata]